MNFLLVHVREEGFSINEVSPERTSFRIMTENP